MHRQTLVTLDIGRGSVLIKMLLDFALCIVPPQAPEASANGAIAGAQINRWAREREGDGTAMATGFE